MSRSCRGLAPCFQACEHGPDPAPAAPGQDRRASLGHQHQGPGPRGHRGLRPPDHPPADRAHPRHLHRTVDRHHRRCALPHAARAALCRRHRRAAMACIRRRHLQPHRREQFESELALMETQFQVLALGSHDTGDEALQMASLAFGDRLQAGGLGRPCTSQAHRRTRNPVATSRSGRTWPSHRRAAGPPLRSDSCSLCRSQT